MRRLAIVLGMLGAASLGVPRRGAGQDLSCRPGDTEVRRLLFSGNRTFPDETLANSIVTTPSSWSRRVWRVFGTRRCLDRTEFPRDRLRLIIFYRKHGFIDARVDTVVRSVRPGVADIIFRIREGRPIVVDSIGFQGLDSVAPKVQAHIVRDLPIRRGEPFDLPAIEATRDTLRLRLRNEGFPFAEVLRDIGTDTVRKVGTVTFKALTKSRARIDSVLVAVHPRLVGKAPNLSSAAVRTVMGLKRGRLYRVNDLIAAQRRLFQTDAFEHIAVDLVPDSGRPVGQSDTLVDVQADVIEGYMSAARVGVGWATLDCFRTQAEYADRDAFGGLHLLRVTGSITKLGIGAPFRIGNGGLCPTARTDIYSDTLNYSLSASLHSPVLFGAQLNPTLTLFSARHSEYNAYVRSTPIGASFTLTRRLTSALSLSPEYRIDLGRTSAQPALYCAVFNLCTPADIQPLQKLLPLAVAGALAVQDRRDDIYYPSRGSLITVETLVGSRFLGSAARFQFNRATADAAGYLRVGQAGVVAGRIRLGAVAAYGSEAAGFIPPDQRLYAGGPTTVRGFRQNELGPVVYIPNVVDTIRGTDTVLRAVPGAARQGERVVPDGGNWSVVGNLEYRFPSPFLTDLLQWAVFADAGQVWNGNVSRIHGLLWTPGLGVRVRTFVGPIRLDVGYNPYTRPAGAAYFNAPVPSIRVGNTTYTNPGQVPLYCVSPTNSIPVHHGTVPAGPYQASVLLQDQGFQCPETYVPVHSRTFLQQLTINLSIGQAF